MFIIEQVRLILLQVCYIACQCFDAQSCGAESRLLRLQDINMGCPIDLVCNKGAGSALLQRPGKMGDVVRAASRCLSVPLTFKLRKVSFEQIPQR